MEKCLVTKLKGIVDNNNLPIFNTLKLKINPLGTGQQSNFHLACNVGTLIKATNSGSFTINGVQYSERTIVAADGSVAFTPFGNLFQVDITPANREFELLISNKYTDMIGFSDGVLKVVYDLDLDELSKMENLEGINANCVKLSGELKVSDKMKFVSIARQDTDSKVYSLSLDPDIEYTEITMLRFFSPGEHMNFDLMQLKKCLNLNLISQMGAPLLTGEIDDLCTALYNNGKTSGTANFEVPDCGVTDGGNLVTLPYIASKGGTNRISAAFSGSGYTKSYV